MKIIPNLNYSILLLAALLFLNACDSAKSVSRQSMSAAKTPIDTVSFDKSSRFFQGIARVEKDSSTFFINTNGKRVFKNLIHEFQPLDSVSPTNNGMLSVYKNEKKLMRIVQLDNGNYGMLNDSAEWVLQPEYDTIALLYDRYLKLEKEGKTTYADTWGNLIVPFEFDDVQILGPRYFNVKKDEKWGVYDAEHNKVIIPFEYDDFDYCSGCGKKPDYFYAEKNGKWGVINLKNEVLVPFNYQHIHSNMRSDEWVAAFRKEGKNVIINIPQQKEFAAPEYDSFQIENGHLIAAKTIDDHRYYGVINRKGEEVIPFEYSGIYNSYSSFQSGPYFSIKKDEKFGIIDTLGKVIIPPSYKSQLRVQGHYFISRENRKVGVLDRENTEVLPPRYDEIIMTEMKTANNKTESIFKLTANEKYGFYIPKTGKRIRPTYDKIHFLSNGQRTPYVSRAESKGLISLEKDGKTKLYNLNTHTMIADNYVAPKFLPHQKMLVSKEDYGDQGLYDLKEDTLILPINYKSIQVFEEQPQLIKVVKDVGNYQTQAGLMDEEGKEVLPVHYAEIEALDAATFLLHERDSLYYSYSVKAHKKEKLPFTNVLLNDSTSLLSVQKNGKMYLYDYKRKQLLLNEGYSEIQQLKNGNFILFQKDSTDQLKFGYANAAGELMVPVIYDTKATLFYPILEFEHYLLLLKEDKATGKMLEGFASLEGKILVPPHFDKVYPEESGNGFLTIKNNRYGVITADGRELLKPLYVIGIYDRFNSRTQEMSFKFPVPFEHEGVWQFMREDGTKVPIKAQDLILFQ